MADTISTVVVANPENPDAKSDTAAKIDIQSNVANMNLAELDTADAYTFRFWGKILSDDPTATKTTKLIFDDMTEIETFTFTTEWQMFECSFLADAETETFMQFPTGTYIMWHSKIEHGTNASQYSESPLDFKIVTSGTIDVLSDKIELKVQKDEIIASINISPEEISIDANRININGVTSINDKFKVNLDGSMETIAGKIGGWNISDTQIYHTETSNGHKYTIALNSDDMSFSSRDETYSGTTVTNTKQVEVKNGSIVIEDTSTGGTGSGTTSLNIGKINSQSSVSTDEPVIDIIKKYTGVMGYDETIFGLNIFSIHKTSGGQITGGYDFNINSNVSNGIYANVSDVTLNMYSVGGGVTITGSELACLDGLSTNIKTGKQDTLAFRAVTISNVAQVSAGGSLTLSVTYPSGISSSKMMGIVGFNVGSTDLVPISIYWDNGGLHMIVRNISSSAVTPSSPSITILYKA